MSNHWIKEKHHYVTIYPYKQEGYYATINTRHRHNDTRIVYLIYYLDSVT